MTEAAAVTEYTIRVPVWTEKMIAAWAKSLGWQPTVLDADGNSIANPVEPIYACLSAALTTGSSQAVHQISQEAAESARVAAIEESATMMQAILAATMAGTAPEAQAAMQRGAQPPNAPPVGPAGLGVTMARKAKQR